MKTLSIHKWNGTKLAEIVLDSIQMCIKCIKTILSNWKILDMPHMTHDLTYLTYMTPLFPYRNSKDKLKLKTKKKISPSFNAERKIRSELINTLILCPIWFFIILYGKAFLFFTASPHNNLRICKILARWDSDMAFGLTWHIFQTFYCQDF